MKDFNVKLFANAEAAAAPNANAGGSTIALPGLCPGELKLLRLRFIILGIQIVHIQMLLLIMSHLIWIYTGCKFLLL